MIQQRKQLKYQGIALKRVHIFPWLAFSMAFLALAGCSQTAPSPQVGTVLKTAEIRKSPNDDRAYRYLELPNKLRAVLVSDPATEKAAAALSIYRGSFHEPQNRAGLAHFLEHMLFIQTEAYPEVDGFQNFINANGGSSNAYTALDHTNYFFNVQPSGFREGLDRFAHFFINPTLSPEYSQREKNAVHSEFKMQLRVDSWRGYMVGKQALNPAHPASKFTIGSLETLDGDIHEDLKDFFEREYSADQMGLVAISNESLNQMQSWIVPLFSKIENKDIGPAYPDMPIYTDAELPARVEYQTLKDGARVSYMFPLPSARTHYKNKPEQYFSNIIGHEGSGSLYQLLNSYGWIESLGAGVSELDRNTSALAIRISLTPEGRTHIEEITDLLFHYIDLIKQTPPQQWMYDEQAKVAEIGFRFQEKSQPTGLVYQLAPRLDEYPPKDLLVAPYLMEQFDAPTIVEMLSYITPDNLLMEVSAPDIEGSQTEPWFEVPYNLTRGPIQRTPIDNIEQALAQLSLPQENPYLPDDLALEPADNRGIERGVSESGMELWVDADVEFGSPRANMFIELAVAEGLITPTDRAKAQLYRLLVEDAMSEMTYPAYLAGLGYSLSVPDSGYQIRIGGYADKQKILLATVLDSLLTANISVDRFDSLKASLIKDWRNAAKERPFNQAFTALADTLRSGRWPRPLLIEALEPVTLDDLMSWREDKLASVAVRGLIHGNVANDDVTALQTLLQEKLTVTEHNFVRATVREVDDALRLQLAVEHNDASMVLHVQDPDDSFGSRAQSSLAAQILHQSYFQQLRTEQQLGYVVSVTNRPIAKRGGISFVVQSPNTSAAGLEEATLEFVDTFVSSWSDIPAEEFELHKSGLINRLMEKPKNLNERSQRYWGDLTDEWYTFDSRNQVAEQVAQLTQADMMAFFERLQTHLQTERLLIFTQGQFAEIPDRGRLLTDATQSWEDVPAS